MSDEQLKAVSPIDGRYSKKVQHLREIFSESALMRYRVIAEITWLQYLSDCDQMDQIPSMDSQLKDALTKIHADFSLSDAKKIKEIEKPVEKIKQDQEKLNNIKKTKPKKQKSKITFIRICKNLEECDIDKISKIVMEIGKEKDFPDITN